MKLGINSCVTHFLCAFPHEFLTKSKIVSYPTPSQPFQVWQMDLYGPLPPSPNGNIYIFTAIDMFSKLLCALPIRNKDVATIFPFLESRKAPLLCLWCYLFRYVLLKGNHERVSNFRDKCFPAIDMFSKLLCALPIRNKDVATVSHAICSLTTYFGVPQTLISDQGKEFIGKCTKNVCSILTISNGE
jgi:hypothetical protein